LAENIRFENVKKYKNLPIMKNLMEWNCWLLAENIRFENVKMNIRHKPMITVDNYNLPRPYIMWCMYNVCKYINYQ